MLAALSLPCFPTLQGAGMGSFSHFLSLNCPGESFLGFFSWLCLDPVDAGERKGQDVLWQ